MKIIIVICVLILFYAFVFCFNYGAGKQNKLYDEMMENNKTLSEALPELEAIAKELGMKVNNGKVLEEYFKRHPEEKKEKLAQTKRLNGGTILVVNNKKD